MKLVFPEVDTVFDCEIDKANCLVVENQQLFYRMIKDLYAQVNGKEGRSVLSENDRVLTIGKNLELISQFVPFEMNRRPLVNKAISILQQIAYDETHYLNTVELMSEIERYMLSLSMEATGNLGFSEVTVEAIVKACGIAFADDYASLGEKLIDYFELVTEYDHRKLFVLVNIRSFLSDIEAEQFIKTSIEHGYQIFMLESCSRSTLKSEKRYLVDDNLCEICLNNVWI